MPDILDILSQAGRSARDIATIKAGLLRQNASQNAGPMARGFEEGLIGEGVDMARAGVGALGDAYGAGDGALEKLLAGYTDRMAKARARAAALRAQSPEAFAYGEKLPERVADAAGLIGVAGHLRMPELPRIGPGAAPELAFARTGGEMPAMRMPEAGPKPISRAGEPVELEQRARHGTRVKNMEKFDFDHMGSGEGTQWRGWGGYFAEHPKTGDRYREIASKSGSPEDGQLYAFEIPENKELLDYDKRLFEQSEGVISSLEKSGILPKTTRKWIDIKKALWESEHSLSNGAADVEYGLLEELEKLPRDGLSYNSSGEPVYGTSLGSTLYNMLSQRNGPRAASEALRASGIPGLRFLDAGSRDGSAANGTHNFVIWDEARIGKPEPTTLERELQLMAGGE